MGLDRRERMKRVALTVYLSWVVLFTGFVQAQDPESLNIDCGATSSYLDDNGWKFVPDDEFIDGGKIYNVSSYATIEPLYNRTFLNLRSFPSGNRNCYRFKSVKGTMYLIRSRSFYGNYDNLNFPPQFDLYIGVDYATTVLLPRYPEGLYNELITVATSDLLLLCLMNTGLGIPIISEIRLVTLPSNFYGNITSSGSLVTFTRQNKGSDLEGFRNAIHYPEDIYDRVWFGVKADVSITTMDNFNYSKVPSKVLQTAAVLGDNDNRFGWLPELRSSTDLFHFALHFAELEKLQANESRVFNIYQQERLMYGPLQPKYLSVDTIYSKQPMEGKTLDFNIKKTTSSTRTPLISAIELFQFRKFSGSTTNRQDVDSIMGIKNAYQVKKNWIGDPCLPKKFSWSGLTCNDNDSPQITALNLSSSGLNGSISPYLANISSIVYIDLSNNNLTGAIPEFLAQLTSLKELNVSNNNLSGSIPNSLIEKLRNGLKLSIDNNPDLNKTVIENHKGKKRAVVPIIFVSLATFILFVAVIIFCIFRRKNRQKSLHMPNRTKTHRKFELPAEENKKFTYSEVSKMTNKFENVIGKGGFGLVYSGSLDGMRVAVKVLSESSKQGSKEFSTEIKLLMKIHHKNLVSLVGYCLEDTKMVLIYECMERGNLREMLSSDSTEKHNFLSWKQRLRIALDAAQGLDYLHHGCKPPIIHRDVKTSNILLNGELEAKVADFGLSKAYPIDGCSHLSTVVMGTPGYIDPHYIALRHLNEKSDVYSFGVVLFELLTGETPLGKNPETIHIVQRVKHILDQGEIGNVIDPRLNGECDVNIAWKFAEIALECTLQSSVQRPSMSKVVSELKECLISETSKYKQRYGDEAERYIISNQDLDTELTVR